MLMNSSVSRLVIEMIRYDGFAAIKAVVSNHSDHLSEVSIVVERRHVTERGQII